LNFLEISSYFPRKKTGAKTRLVAAIGIGSSTGTSYSVLVLAVLKLFNSVMFLMPISAKKYSAKDSCHIKIGCPFHCSFLLGKQKKGGNPAQAKKGNDAKELV